METCLPVLRASKQLIVMLYQSTLSQETSFPFVGPCVCVYVVCVCVCVLCVCVVCVVCVWRVCVCAYEHNSWVIAVKVATHLELMCLCSGILFALLCQTIH